MARKKTVEAEAEAEKEDETGVEPDESEPAAETETEGGLDAAPEAEEPEAEPEGEEPEAAPATTTAEDVAKSVEAEKQGAEARGIAMQGECAEFAGKSIANICEFTPTGYFGSS